ncbi:MAG: hypothetical protein WBP82_08725 [Leuconostoc mesenteroides]
MKIQLTQGQITIIDDEDFDKINHIKWSANYCGGKYYARGYCKITKKNICLHNILLPKKDNSKVDHKNGDSLDNRKSNLRYLTLLCNRKNRRMQKNNTTEHRGVYLTNKNKYAASIRDNNKLIQLGLFNTKEEAALAYNNAATKYHKEFVRLNDVK